MEKITSIPEAKLLLNSLRSVGYTPETAIADIIDNCISANASLIKINFDYEKERILISDNGEGMTKENLIKNMRIGSSDPNEIRDEKDLGRFGMGLKTAAFSLGKKLTVITKTDEGEISNATWNLDEIPQIGWNLIIETNDNLSEFISFLDKQGTIVIIENLDRLIDSTDETKAKKKFYKVIEKVEKHVSLIFHRFLNEDEFTIEVNGNEVEGWDPFISSNNATQELAEEMVWSNSDSAVVIQPYVLPHKTKFNSDEEYELAGGVKGWNYHQGIYVYRNKRLIIYGTWFDYIKKEPAYNLARIRVDITPADDDDWKIDIKKSAASIPLYVKDAIERAIDITTKQSALVYNSRGKYSISGVSSPNLDYVWEQRKKDGIYSFHLNRKHALLSSIKKLLNKKGQNDLATYLSLIENFAPFIQSGLVNTMKSVNKRSGTYKDSLEYKIALSEVREIVASFKANGFADEEIKLTLYAMPDYSHLREEINSILEEE